MRAKKTVLTILADWFDMGGAGEEVIVNSYDIQCLGQGLVRVCVQPYLCQYITTNHFSSYSPATRSPLVNGSNYHKRGSKHSFVIRRHDHHHVTELTISRLKLRSY